MNPKNVSSSQILYIDRASGSNAKIAIIASNSLVNVRGKGLKKY
jgi:hypothetical protein